jgi:hypothetical protein
MPGLVLELLRLDGLRRAAALAAAPAQDRPVSGQYFRRIAFMSKSATPHQNSRLGFEIVKNARADSPARPDSLPARVGFFKSWTADEMTATPRR